MQISKSTTEIDIRKEVIEAEKRIREYIRETPVEYSPYLSQLGNCNVYLKLENIQLSGSFKLRGAVNKILSLSKEEIDRGIMIGSSGNHGIAFAYLFQKFNINGTIYFPENSSPSKIEVLRLYGANLKFHGIDSAVTETFAHNMAIDTNQIYISPYNDPKIIGGQGTIAIELKKQLEGFDEIIVPIGGGGLVAGIAGYLKSEDKNIKIIGSQPENSPVMVESIKAGRIIEMKSKPSISDGTVGGIEADSITFDLCKELVDDYILVSENEIKESIKLILEKHYMLVEGAAALSVASFIKSKERFRNKNIVLIVSGNRSVLERLKEIIF